MSDNPSIYRNLDFESEQVAGTRRWYGGGVAGGMRIYSSGLHHYGYKTGMHMVPINVATVRGVGKTGISMVFAGGGGVYNVGDDLDQLRLEHEALALEVVKLKREVLELATQVAALTGDIPLRELTDSQAKAEIKAYFENHHGEMIYPSDVARALSLDYDCVDRWMQELERDGQITTTAGPADNATTDARPE